MDIFIIVVSFMLAYAIFILIAIKLAKILFPKIQDEEMEMKEQTVRQRHRKRLAV